jgi:outer membrane protein TolC
MPARHAQWQQFLVMRPGGSGWGWLVFACFLSPWVLAQAENGMPANVALESPSVTTESRQLLPSSPEAGVVAPSTVSPVELEEISGQQAWNSPGATVPDYLLPSDSVLASPWLKLSDVVASVYRAFPLIEQARLQQGVAAGEQLSAWGAYDLKAEGYSLNQPFGYYETYRQGLGVARQLWWGGYLGAGYRLGRGTFEQRYKERETDDGGEFKLAVIQPLLQGRAIDSQRVELFQANLRRQAVTPEIQTSLLGSALDAVEAYWSWVSAGAILKSQFRLLELAEIRGEQLSALLAAGQGKQIDVIVNDQLIAERRGMVVESEKKLWQSAAKLGLYLRDDAGQPLLAPVAWLPPDIATILDLPAASFEQDFGDALARRPELQLIDFEIQQNRWEVQLANNQLLPNLDLTLQGSQDTGEPASALGDKGEFELEAGVIGSVPVQRRKARGKLQSYRSKIAILEQKRRFQQDKIAIELQTAQTSILTTAESIRQAQQALASAKEALETYRLAFDRGQVDLVFLNLVEPKVTEYEIKLIEQEQKWYSALAAKQAALGLDPLEQAMAIDGAVSIQAPGAGNQPPPLVPQPNR